MKDEEIAVLLVVLEILLTVLLLLFMDRMLKLVKNPENPASKLERLLCSPLIIIEKNIYRYKLHQNKTMNEEQKKVLKIVKLLKEYPSTTIYDILHQTEVLVNSLDPLDGKSCKTELFGIAHPDAIKLDNGTFLLPNGSAYGLHFYTLYNPNTFIAIGTSYYYKTRLDLRPQKLTRTNLLASAKDTKLEVPIQEYLFNHKLLKRDPKTKKLKLITFLEERLKGSTSPYLLSILSSIIWL